MPTLSVVARIGGVIVVGYLACGIMLAYLYPGPKIKKSKLFIRNMLIGPAWLIWGSLLITLTSILMSLRYLIHRQENRKERKNAQKN